MQTAVKTKFNLLHEPWIGCITARGKPETLGLLALLERANELRDLSESSPIVRVAIYRLLLAILYRTQQIDGKQDWRALWQNGWDTPALCAYLEKWESHFDLFSKTTPFYQRADLDTGGRTTPITKLSPEFTAGRNKQLSDHSSDDDPPSFSPNRAARLLLAAQTWSIGGGASNGGRPNFTTAALPKGLCLLAIGESLRETLTMNLAPLTSLRPTPRQLVVDGCDDRPAWERGGSAMIDARMPDGPADWYTWQPRYVRFLPEADGTIRFAALAQGERPEPASLPFIDPFHAYAESKTAGKLPRTLVPGRAAWRDAESLFASANADGGTSATIHHLVNVRSSVPPIVPVLVAGLAIPGGQPPPDVWLAELFRVPMSLFTPDSDAVRELNISLALAQKAADALRRAVFNYANTFMKMENGGADPKDVRKLADGLSRELDYWAALERPFHELLPTLGEPEPATAAWHDAVRRAVIAAFDASLLSQDATGRHLRALNTARATFYGKAKGIGNLFPKQENADDGNDR